MNDYPEIPFRRLRLGMVGGGSGAFIGAVHRLAARMDDQYELVAGAFSADPQKSRAAGVELRLDPARCYDDFASMAKAEAARADGIDVVSIVTPNHMHKAPILAFLSAGIHVICDKPLALSFEDGLEIEAAIQASGCIFALTHNYSATPMVRQAREMVAAGEIGQVRLVQVEYPQQWLCEPLEATGHKQAAWRTDPARSGPGGCIGDIGTHAYQLADFVTQVPLLEISAELSTFMPDRRLDDNVQIMLRYQNGARGMLWTSQIAVGHENGLRLRVYGSKGALHWVQADPNYLQFSRLGMPSLTLTRGGDGSGVAAGRVTRVPSGHPEGYLEAFANIYAEVARAIVARKRATPCPADVLFPDASDGVKGLAFIEAAIASSKANSAWIKPRRV